MRAGLGWCGTLIVVCCFELLQLVFDAGIGRDARHCVAVPVAFPRSMAARSVVVTAPVGGTGEEKIVGSSAANSR